MVIRHESAQISPHVRLHFADAGTGDTCVVLIHGFPQTWWSWRRVIEPLAGAGFRVIAPDIRGAGSSSRPAGGYDTTTLAEDLHALVRGHLAHQNRLHLVGHDIGSMIALAYALRFRGDLDRLVLMEATLPGTRVYERLKTHPQHWHFAFHQRLDVPEQLTAGQERTYLKLFFDSAAFNPEAITYEDLERYARAYEQPGAMRAGLELYRAFERNADNNRRFLLDGGRLQLPLLGIAGAGNLFADVTDEMLSEIAGNVRTVVIPAAGHWVPEENPNALTEALLSFLDP
jgi:pimeloyl-ACP methyl ester carboxylesterase